MNPTIYIVRGLPGSGKSTIAKKLVHYTKHFEADMFFMENGVYCFNPAFIKDAHEWCFNSIESAMKTDCDCCVSNTFTQRWEYQPYLDLAERYDYNVQIIECHGDFGNIHDVPEQVIENMKKDGNIINNC